MEGDTTVTPPTAGIESDLINLAEVTLADLPAYDEEALEPTLRRLLARIDDPESITTGYNPQRID